MNQSGIAWLLMGGFIATALAAQDPDIEAAKAAYEDKEHEKALEALERAQQRRGERPEIAYNRGLVNFARGDKEAAQKALQRGSEAEEPKLRASAFFELGNLAFDGEDWEGAIASYIECLKSNPEHEDAKWNLELALQNKKKQEEDEKKENEDQKDKDQDNSDNSDNQDSSQQDSSQQDSQDQNSEDTGENSNSQQDSPQGSSSGSGGEQGGQDSSQEQDSKPQSSGGQQDQPSEQDSSSGAQQEPEKPQAPPENPQAAPIEQGDLDQALDALDQADPFMFGVPRGRVQPVDKDW